MDYSGYKERSDKNSVKAQAVVLVLWCSSLSCTRTCFFYPADTWYLLTHIHLLPPLAWVTTIFIFLSSTLLDFTYNIFVFLCMTYYTCHNIFLIHSCWQMIEFPSFLRLVVFHCIYMTFLFLNILLR